MPPDEPGPSRDDGRWAELDREVERLDEAYPPAGPGVDLHGFLRFVGGRYERSTVASDEGRSNAAVTNARISLDGRAGNMSVFLSLEGSSEEGGGYLLKEGEADEVRILDAWATLELGRGVDLRVGQFRPPVLFTSLLDENQLLFIDRTFDGFVWQERDPGAMLLGQHERLRWWLAMQNGENGAAEDPALTGRVTLRVLGEGEALRREGAYDADLGHTLYVGGSWRDDASLDDGTTLALEAYYTWERLSLSGELVEYGADLLGGSRFWAATASLMLVPELWEVAARVEDFSDSRSGLFLWRLGVNRYLGGPASRVQGNLTRLEHERADASQTLVELGLTASF